MFLTLKLETFKRNTTKIYEMTKDLCHIKFEKVLFSLFPQLISWKKQHNK